MPSGGLEHPHRQSPKISVGQGGNLFAESIVDGIIALALLGIVIAGFMLWYGSLLLKIS